MLYLVSEIGRHAKIAHFTPTQATEHPNTPFTDIALHLLSLGDEPD